MLQELNKESLLLLYQADELPAAERAQVERMLASDASLRANLEKLNGALESFEAGMALLDARPVAAESVMTRRIGSAMRQRLAERMAQTAPTAAQRRSRYPVWAYPLAAAAAVLIVVLGYWGHQPDGPAKIPSSEGPIVKIPNLTGNTRMPNDGNSSPSAPATEDPQVAEMTDNFTNGNSTQPEKSVVSLDVAEHHLAELARSRDQLVPSVLGFNDGNE